MVQKWPFRDAHLLFKKRVWNPYLNSVFWVRAFWAKVSKKEILKSHQEKWKIWLIIEKLFFGIFALFWGGFFFFVFCFCCFFVLFFWLFNTKNLVFSPRKGHFLFIFSVSLSFSLSLFWPPSVCVSLSLSLFFLLFFLSSFLSLFLLSYGSLFLSLSFFFFLLCFSFMKGTTSKKSIASFFFINILSFLVSCLLFFQVSFSYLCYFLILSYVFYSTSRFLVSKQTAKKKQIFLVKRGVATKRFFFINLCFAKCEKLSFFWCPFFGQILGDVQKRYKNGYLSTFLKAKKWKKRPFLIVTNWATLIVTNWATFAQLKKRQRGPVSNY